MAEPLTEDQRSDFLAAHPEWALEGETISRTFVFKDFGEAMGFVTRAAMASDVADHHPDIDIRWNKVTMTLTTHDAGALTARDVDLAEKFDSYAV